MIMLKSLLIDCILAVSRAFRCIVPRPKLAS
uniref:Uncharacterized protein n=1 Tax=Anguilla anguilla TaxID=7936 RepID=A0A0E9RDV2_ANGAN